MRKVLAIILVVLGCFTVLTPQAYADEVVIAALGDSLTQGYGLPPEDGFVPQLQSWVQVQGAEVRLINAGVSGDTTAGGLSRAAWTLTPEVDALIVTLGGNDLLRGLDPAEARKNIEGILIAAQEARVEVLLIGMQAPGNFGADYKTQFDAIYPELAEKYETLYLESFFLGLAEAGAPSDPLAVQKWMQSDGIHPNAAGVKRIVDSVGPSVLSLIEAVKGND